MSAQLDLFADVRSRHDDPPTSVEAAAKVRPNNQASLAAIAEIVDSAGYYGATRDEIFQRIVLDRPNAARDTVSSAVSRAVKAGLIVPRGYKHCRLSLRNVIQEIYITERNRGERNG